VDESGFKKEEGKEEDGNGRLDEYDELVTQARDKPRPWGTVDVAHAVTRWLEIALNPSGNPVIRTRYTSLCYKDINGIWVIR